MVPHLKPQDVTAIRARFQQELRDEVTMHFFRSSAGGLTVPGLDCQYCGPTQEILQEVAAIDPRLRLEVHSVVGDRDAAERYGIERVPALVIGRDGARNVRYYGIPAGFEFALLIEDLIAASRGDSGLAEATRQALARLTDDVHIMVFVTPTCPHCPRASRLAHAMAQESPRVTADVIEAMEFPQLADRYGVYGVPKIVINETSGFEGALPEAAFVEHVLGAVPARAH